MCTNRQVPVLMKMFKTEHNRQEFLFDSRVSVLRLCQRGAGIGIWFAILEKRRAETRVRGITLKRKRLFEIVKPQNRLRRDGTFNQPFRFEKWTLFGHQVHCF